MLAAIRQVEDGPLRDLLDREYQARRALAGFLANVKARVEQIAQMRATAQEVTRSLDRHIQKEEFSPDIVGLLKTCRSQMALHESKGEFDKALEVGLYSNYIVELEQIKRLAESLESSANLPSLSMELRTKIDRFLKEAEAAKKEGVNQQGLGELRNEGTSLLLEVHKQIPSRPQR